MLPEAALTRVLFRVGPCDEGGSSVVCVVGVQGVLPEPALWRVAQLRPMLS